MPQQVTLWKDVYTNKRPQLSNATTEILLFVKNPNAWLDKIFDFVRFSIHSFYQAYIKAISHRDVFFAFNQSFCRNSTFLFICLSQMKVLLGNEKERKAIVKTIQNRWSHSSCFKNCKQQKF